MEQYENKNTLQEHQKSDHGKYYFPKIRELLEKIDVSELLRICNTIEIHHISIIDNWVCNLLLSIKSLSKI